MSGSLTVIGGHSNTQGLSSLVTVPAGFTGGALTSLQALLTSASGAVSTSGANFENLAVAQLSGIVTPVAGGFSAGVLVVSNATSLGASLSGSANVAMTVPSGFNTLVVQAPGTETITGNGASSVLAVFGSNSTVNYADGGGSGSVYASGHDFASLTGSDSFFGGSGGANTVYASGATEFVSLAGANNTVSTTAANATINSAGSADFVITANPGNNNVFNVTGDVTIRNLGAADTITATGSGKFFANFRGTAGGTIDFINNSTGASSIIASLNASGNISSQGSVTVNASTGGGVYDGGISGNNSLVGGTGAVTLFAAGVNNYLFTNGEGVATAYNLINAYSGSNDTLIGGSLSINNDFFAGTGTESIVSAGSGSQNYFVGTQGSETISASTVSGATNVFFFQQAASQGGGNDVLINFKPGEAHINLGNGVTGVSVLSYETLHGASGGTEIDLSNGTTVKIIGVAPTAFNASIVGGTSF